MFKWFKRKDDYKEIFTCDERIIPNIVFDYFEIPETEIRNKEFIYIMKKLNKIYSKSFDRDYRPDEFFVYSCDKSIDFLSADRKEIQLFVNYIKSRPEMDAFLMKYGYDKQTKKPLLEKTLHIDYLLNNCSIKRLATSKKGSINKNYLDQSMDFRIGEYMFLFDRLPCFNYSDLMDLSYQIDISRSEAYDYWNYYNNFWVVFGYDELFSPMEYARAFEDVYFRNKLDFKNQIILLRLSRNDLLGSYDGIDGVYYFLFALDMCIQNGVHPKRLAAWMLNGLKMYRKKKEVIMFCKLNSISL